MKRDPKYKNAREQRQVEAVIRQEESNKLTPQQRLANLDVKFGKDKGAVKERLKLHEMISGKRKGVKFTITVDATAAKDQIQKVTKAVQQFNQELEKVSGGKIEKLAQRTAVPSLPPLDTVVSRVG